MREIDVQPAAFQVRKDQVTWWVASETVQTADGWMSQSLCNHRHRTSTGAIECSRVILTRNRASRSEETE